MKIEFDIPEFKKELKIEVTIRRDGEVIYSAQSDTAEEQKPESSTTTKAKKNTATTNTTTKSGGSSKGGGNMMNIEEL